MLITKDNHAHAMLDAITAIKNRTTEVWVLNKAYLQLEASKQKKEYLWAQTCKDMVPPN